MSYAIKVEHQPAEPDYMRYRAAMYVNDTCIPGTTGFGTTSREAQQECADKFEAQRNAEPDEWIAYTPAGT